MGKVLDSYLTTFGSSLMAVAAGQDMAQSIPGPASINGQPNVFPAGPQPSGATTFPMEGPNAQAAPPGSRLTFGQPQHRSNQEMRSMQRQPNPIASFDSPQGFVPGQPMGQPQSTFEPPAQRNDGRGGQGRMKPEDVKTFDDLMNAASDEEINAGIDIIEKQAGGEDGMRNAYAKITGNPPDDRLSRKEIGTLLMEFGLRTLAYNDSSNGGLGAVGRAGAETLGMAREMKREKRDKPMVDAAQASSQKEADLRNSLLEAQIEKAKQDPTDVMTDQQGRLVIINTAKGTSQVIVDQEGQPIMGSEEGSEFASQVDRQAYEAAFCDGLDGEAKKRCQQRAIAYSKGGAATLAFPELRRERIAEGVWDFIRDPDNSSSQFEIGGQTKRIRTMTDDDRVALADRLIEMQMQTINSAAESNRQSAPAAPGGWQQFEAVGLTEEGARKIKEGQRAKLEDSEGNVIGYIANREGKLVRTDTQGKVIE